MTLAFRLSPRPKHESAVRVVVAAGLDRSPSQLLDDVLSRAGFWDFLTAETERRGRALTIAIKPDMDFFHPSAPTGTTPPLVEELVQRLFDAGYGAATVLDGCNVDDTWLFNRDALCVPDVVGYRFSVPAGPYTVVGSGEQLVRGNFPVGHPLQNAGVSAPWVNADVRIIFAKNKTDEELGFALGAYNLLGLLPEFRQRTDADTRAARCVELLRQFPVHFCLIDAVVSSHGPAGSRLPCPIETHTLIASTSLLLADWVGAIKMGLDPYSSPINALALRTFGLPDDFAIDGGLTPYPLWRNPHPAAADSVRSRNRSALAARFARPLLQPVHRESFPFRDLAVDRLNSYLTAPRPDGAGAPLDFGGWVAPLNFLVGAAAGAADAFRSVCQKHRVPQVELPLQFDPFALADEDYDRVRPIVDGFERLVKDAPVDRFGHRWRVVDGAVLFHASHRLAIPFDEFVAAVEVHRAIQFMNDYLGGSAVVVGRTPDGRVSRQAERNVYLPQPNWTAWFGARTIDVEKIEVIAYEADRHQLWWRTLNSPNQSADCDDGSVTFRRDPAGGTEVAIFTRQKFPLPLALAWLRLDRHRDLYDPLVAAAYHAFVAQTLHNLQQHFSGQPYRIGHPSREADRRGAPLLSGDLAVAGTAAVGILTEVLNRGPVLAEAVKRFFAPATSAPPRGHADEDGFRHFPGGTGGAAGRADGAAEWARAALAEAPGFFRGLASAVQKDLATLADPNRGETP